MLTYYTGSLNTVASEMCLEDMKEIGKMWFIALE